MEACRIIAPTDGFAGAVQRVQTARWQPTDREVVALVQAGDREAFGLLVGRYQDRIYSLAYNYLGREDDARDATQETFVKAFRQIGNFGGRSDIYTWLYRIAVNCCIDHLRRAGARKEVADAEVTLEMHADGRSDPETELERNELRRRLLAGIRGLSPKLRMALVLHDVEGYTLEEAARSMRCTLGTAKSRLWRARDELRRTLQADPGYDEVAI